ncbi:WD40-repeat-containing domain protein [Dimargaris cristalligena]|uniref:U three protein 7 n=1 Tax=Dimargaris cristalligena TaxID=215637 RepID=A0A4Q0A1V6_9FUNG|nr:WD40-repeat-containing domain protein [Dimargaris cristalligena]|eukprot:RKP40073.1 WD40-repeat-containing domain protein [Dimargaris cristalligena]
MDWLTGQKLQLVHHHTEASAAAAVAEVLQVGDAGFLEPEGIERTSKVTQKALKSMVDANTAAKMYNLDLDKLGPYFVDYSRSGRQLLLGGRKGHVATFDWQRGDLTCEVQLQETIRAVTWLQDDESLFAVAQKQYAYIYDATGAEVHCLKQHRDPNVLSYLPHHFLLASGCESGHLVYQDISTGVVAAKHNPRLGPIRTMALNPWNAIINIGHSDGMVTMWSPNQPNPLVKMRCHNSSVHAVAVDPTGHYMATAGADHMVRFFDIRTYGCLGQLRSKETPHCLTISQRQLVALGAGEVVSVWKDVFKSEQTEPYMEHHSPRSAVESLRFCPYEDVLGVGHHGGFSSLVIPGSGEANLDSSTANPLSTNKQRRELVVRQLLDKIQPDMIALDPNFLGQYKPTDSSKDSAAEANVPTYVNPLKNRARGRNKTGKRVVRAKLNVREAQRAKALNARRDRLDAQKQQREEKIRKRGGVVEGILIQSGRRASKK